MATGLRIFTARCCVLSPPWGGLFSDHLSSLQRRLSSIDLEDAPHVARASVQMLAACVRPNADTTAQARDVMEGVTLGRVQQYIARHLGGAITPEGLCSHFGLSRSQLYRLFEPLGGVANYVQQRRLLQAFHTLVNPASRRLRVAEVAARMGFASNAHFSRAFRVAFGVSPTDAVPWLWGVRRLLVWHGPVVLLQLNTPRGCGR